MSSIDPITTRQLCADADEAGMKWLDCPLSGGAPKALAVHTGTAMPMTSLCMEINRLMVSAGLGAVDNAALMKFYDGPKS